MRSNRSTWRTLAVIVQSTVGAVCCAGLSLWLWPSSPAWWEFGVYSIIFGLAGVLLAVRGLKAIAGLIWHLIEQRWFFRRGREARSDRLADDEAMRRGGMFK